MRTRDLVRCHRNATTQALFTAFVSVAFDVAMLPNEVQPVLKPLRKSGIDVVAIDQHMTSTQPAIFFLCY
jgi:hypothetical protein